MQYRRFGKTEMKLSVFTLGLMRYMTDVPDKSAQVVRRAVELGFNHLETARAYGTSEELLGHALKFIDRSKVYITTKIRPTETYDQFMKLFEASMNKMGIDYLDNLVLHGVNNPEKLRNAVNDKQCWRAIRKLIDAGAVKHIGFSTHGQLPIILETINTRRFESVNLHYYYFYQVNAPAVARAAELDMGVFIISPNEKGGMLFRPPDVLRRLAAPFHPMTLNARWLLGQPQVHTLSLGAAVPSDFDTHRIAADQVGSLSDAEAAAIARWDARIPETLGKDACTVCGQCLPCPQDVNIPEILRLRNLVCAFDMRVYGEFRYNLLDGSNDWFHGLPGNRCTECGDCLPKCPENLAIPELLFDAHDSLHTGPGHRMWE